MVVYKLIQLMHITLVAIIHANFGIMGVSEVIVHSILGKTIIMSSTNNIDHIDFHSTFIQKIYPDVNVDLNTK